jgi:polysaccharide deacetylase family protein (PEP-CTERM system associated)
MVNVISVDVEEYFHAANLAEVAPRSSWSQLPSRVVETTEKTLEIFARHKVQGTFFILGYVAQRFPELVKSIQNAGHEIASHGFEHYIAYEQTQAEFLEDVSSSKKLLEDITGIEVLGYRAPNFSITPKNQWAFDCLIEAGYKYDSSRYPVWHPRYANIGASTTPEYVVREKGKILEFPLATARPCSKFNNFNLPIAGGAYWRLLPLPYSLWGLRSRQKQENTCTACYFHPWELDSEQPRFKGLGFLTQLRHYGRTHRFEKVLDSILSSFEFEPFNKRALNIFSEH